MLASPFQERSSGVLLHPTSLPGPHGSGDLGPAAHRFAEFLARAGQRWWQMLPVGPVGGGESPYDSPSSFAGNPFLVSLELLARDGLLERAELAAPARLGAGTRCHFPAARRFRLRRLRRAFERFAAGARPDWSVALESFRERARYWLPQYCRFQAARRASGGRHWTEWEPDLARAAAEERAPALADAIRFEEFVQLAFDRQWTELAQRCRDLGVRLLGDVPMYVSHDGADTWSHPELFLLDERGRRRVLAGVPPDYFSAEGQLWGNPVYDWDALRRTGYAWWVERMRATLGRFDAVRLDHFIGFSRAWCVPAGARSAREGQFLAVPGNELLSTLRAALGGLPFLAEDLGLLTREVEVLRDEFELPGMRVLEFAFAEGFRDYQPHRYTKNTVVYTGTHDNDTLAGWLSAAERAESAEERLRLGAEAARALAYAGSSGAEPHWDLVRLAFASPANTAIVPLQDVLGLGTEARMNVPGTALANWRYRCQEHDTSLELAARLRELGDTYERVPTNLARF